MRSEVVLESRTGAGDRERMGFRVLRLNLGFEKEENLGGGGGGIRVLEGLGKRGFGGVERDEAEKVTVAMAH